MTDDEKFLWKSLDLEEAHRLTPCRGSSSYAASRHTPQESRTTEPDSGS